jgi:hypothetical protein
MAGNIYTNFLDIDVYRVKGFSTLVTRYLRIYLRLFLACHMSKILLAMRGTAAPFKPSKTEEGTSPSGNPLMYHFDGGPRRKSDHIFNNISQTKNRVWGLDRALFHCLMPQKGMGQKPVKTRLYEGKGYASSNHDNSEPAPGYIDFCF